MSKALVLGAAALGAFSGRRIGPSARLRLQRSYGSALRLRGAARLRVRSDSSALQLRGSSLCGTGDGRNDYYYRDAWFGLLSASGGVRVL